MQTTFIYSLNDPRNGQVKYIGKSDNPEHRLVKHYSQTYPSLKTNWVKSLRQKGLRPLLEIIDAVPISEWEFWEQHYISLYRSWGFEILNMTIGGDGVKNRKRTEEEKRKISLSLIGNKRTLGYVPTEETRKKLSLVAMGNKSNTGKKLPETQKKNISAGLKKAYAEGRRGCKK